MDFGLEMLDSYDELYSLSEIYSSQEGIGSAILTGLGVIVGIVVAIILAVVILVIKIIALPFNLIDLLISKLSGRDYATANIDEYVAQFRRDYNSASGEAYNDTFLKFFSDDVDYSFESDEEGTGKTIEILNPFAIAYFAEHLKQWYDLLHKLMGRVGNHILDVAKSVKSNEYPLEDDRKDLIEWCKKIKSQIENLFVKRDGLYTLSEIKGLTKNEILPLAKLIKKELIPVKRISDSLKKDQYKMVEQMKNAKELNKYKAVGAKVKELATEFRACSTVVVDVAKRWSNSVVQSIKNLQSAAKL